MRKTRIQYGLILMILMSGFLFTVSCDDEKGKQTEIAVAPAADKQPDEQGPPPAELNLADWQVIGWDRVKDPYAEGQVFAYLDSVPVTVEELERFNFRVLGNFEAGHGGRDDLGVFTALPPYRRYFAANREAVRLGLDQSESFQKRFIFTVRTALAMPYRNWLVNNAPIPPGELQKKLPAEWTEVNFAMRIFPSLAEAEAARAAILGKETFETFKGSQVVARKEIPETGLVFPDSGFFDQWDEVDLFKLQEGDVAGPVKSGIGYAVVLVKERHDFTPEEQAAYIADMRGDLSQQYAASRWEQFFRERQVEIFEGAIEEGIFKELTGAMMSEAVVAVVDGEEITYRLFRILNGKNYTNMRSSMPMSFWKNPPRADLGSLIQQVAMGKMAQEAIEAGQWSGSIPDGIVKTLYDYRRTYLYYSYLDMIREQVATNLSEDEVKKYYKDNRGQFILPAKAEIIYHFTIEPEVADKWREILNGGGNFGDAANFTSTGRSPHSAGAVDTGYSRAVLYQGDNLLKDLQDAVFAMSAGEDAVLEGEMGQYLLSVEALEPSRLQPFDEGREEVVDRLLRQRISDLVGRKVDELAAKVKVKVVGEMDTAPVPEKDIPNPDMG